MNFRHALSGGALLCVLLLGTAAWGQTAQAPVVPDPGTPLAPLPGLGVEWPDLGVRDPLEAVATTAGQPVADPRYAVALTGVDDLPKVRERFDSLSVLKANDGKTANLAQIDRRARDDVDLLVTIMRSEGFYDASVETEVKPAEADGRVLVTLAVTPGAQFKFTDVDVTGAPPEARPAYDIRPDTPVVAETVIDAKAKLIEKLGRTGYPFAKVDDPAITVDHDTRGGTLDLAVDSGGKRNFGAIRYEGGKPPFNAKHAEVIARWGPGDLYDSALLEDFKQAVVATGLISQIRATPVEGAVPGTVDIATTLDPAPFRTLAGEAGYGTGEGVRVEASWQHRNFIQPEGAVTFRGIVGTREQLLGATLRMGNFRRRDQVLNARILFSRDDRAAYDASRFELAGSIERLTTIIWQKPWAYSLGPELAASIERSFDIARGNLINRTFFVAALPGTLAYDGTDSLLDPTRGFRLAARVSPELSLRGRSFAYVRAQFDGSYYQPIGERLVIAGRARIGTIAGGSLATLAPSRLYYAGGGGSVRGFGYQLIGPINPLGQPTGGRSLAEFSLEARVRLPMFGGNFGVVPFVDAGNVYDSTLPKLSGLRVGVGLGLRYYTNFGPIRIDLGTPLARRPGESRVAIQVSLGQAF